MPMPPWLNKKGDSPIDGDESDDKKPNPFKKKSDKKDDKKDDKKNSKKKKGKPEFLKEKAQKGEF